jgi:hypothetical protein
MPARHALSQLSYGPLKPSQCSREIEVLSPVNPLLLIVSRRSETKSNFLHSFRMSNRHEETPVKFQGVEREGIDLISRVKPADQTMAVATSSAAAPNQNVAVPGCPFALNTNQPRVEIEDEVVPSSFSRGPKDLYSKQCCLQRDGHLGNRSLLIRCHTRQPTERIGWAVSV